MPNKTKAQLAEEAKIQRNKELAAKTEEYSSSFAEVLGKARKIGFEITITDGKYVLQSEDESFVLKPPSEMIEEFNNRSYWNLLELKVIFEETEKAEAEKQRKQQIREIALAKLTEEEKEILFSN